jgi:hypothetical protein
VESGDECARRAVSRFKCRVRHLGALAKQAHGDHQPQLLPPLSESCPRLTYENALERPWACAAGFRNPRERPGVRRIAHQHLGDTQSPWIFRHGELKRSDLDRLKLIEDDFNEVTLPGNHSPQRAAATYLQDEFLEQASDVDDATLARNGCSELRFQVKRSHGYLAGHCNSVGRSSGNPYCPMNRNHPSAIVSCNRHYAARSVNQLVTVVEMQRNLVARWVVACQRDDGCTTGRQRVKIRGLSCFRHSLA